MAYDHRAIEARWQSYWKEHETFKAVRHAGRPKVYVLDMFPYPSGSGLHVGHPEGYTATDIFARYKRMRGFDVLHPMGWDAFGLPAEQHAISTGTHPRQTTRENIAHFREQLQSLGFSYDWSREVDTTAPEYFRWTQWIFLKLFHAGLAVQKEIPVNWCPALGTVLANEEIVDGRSERGGHPVVRQPLRQWQLLITKYAGKLLDGLDALDWPDTKQKQREWIGRTEGAEVDFPLVGRSEKLTVYTTRPDTLYGATYMVVAPDHPLTLALAGPAEREAVAKYAEAAARKSDLERTALGKKKTGVFTGARAVNPVNGREIPVYTADYVLGAYGTGAIMAVPAHDERDFAFAREHGLEVVEVVSPDGALHVEEDLRQAFVEEGVAVRSGELDGLPTADAKRRMVELLEARGLGRRRENTKLRDWVFSRQRYWGEPIPVYFPVATDGDPRRGAAYTIDHSTPIAVEEHELPLLLPELEDYHPGDPEGPLVRAVDWRFFQKDGRWYARETNTMPQWAGSCWYYLRFLDPGNATAPFSEEAYDAWMPVDLYVGGAEHAVLHLLYARFWHKVLFDLGVVKDAEPFQRLVHQGMILGMGYRWYAVLGANGEVERALPGDDPGPEVERCEEGLRLCASGLRVEARWVAPPDVRWEGDRPLHAEHGVLLAPVAEKMSKSRGNVVNPDDVVRDFGADALRGYEMFMGPLEQVKPWQTSGIQGIRRWLDKVEALGARPVSEAALDGETAKLVHRTLKKVGDDIESLRFNTALSAMMVLTNHLTSLAVTPREALEKLVLMASPFAPHLAEELWARLGHPPSIAEVPWPVFDEALCVDEVVEVAVQVNGKVRGRVRVPRTATEAAAAEAARGDAAVAKSLEGLTVQKVVYVPGRIVNFIAK